MGKTSLAGKVVLITGASAGIGAALAREYSRRGAQVALTARRRERLETLAQELKSQGGQALALTCDVTQDGDLEKALEETRRQFGKVDVVVANAGFGVVGHLEQLTLADYRRQFETNVFGLLRTIYASLEELKKNRGCLVLIGSVNSYVSLPGTSPYGMSKFAVRALAEALGPELRPHGVGVVLISPGFVESEIRQVDNQGKLREGAADPIFAGLRMPAEKAAREIVDATEKREHERIVTFHGKAAVFVQRHFPWVFRMLASKGLRGRSQPATEGPSKGKA